MSAKGLARLHRILTAAKKSEMARLAGELAQARGHEAEAARLRAAALAPRRITDASDMARAALWQSHLTARAKVEDQAALAALARAEALRPQVATAMGRESAVANLLERARADEARIAAARQEQAPPRPRTAADEIWEAGGADQSSSSPDPVTGIT